MLHKKHITGRPVLASQVSYSSVILELCAEPQRHVSQIYSCFFLELCTNLVELCSTLHVTNEGSTNHPFASLTQGLRSYINLPNCMFFSSNFVYTLSADKGNTKCFFCYPGKSTTGFEDRDMFVELVGKSQRLEVGFTIGRYLTIGLA